MKNRKNEKPRESHKDTKDKKLNPFEIHINHSKHKILGQKSKDDHGLPGISRGKAFRKREKTLLPEYRDRYKNSKFLDLRIGEKSKFLDPEKKILLRIAAEKRKQFSKKSLFNLNDDEHLTHGGKALDDITMRDETAFSDDDDDYDDDMLDASFVKDRHFGGGILTKAGEAGEKDETGKHGKNSGRKTRREWVEEIIAESKLKKADSKREKEVQHDAVSKLNSKFQDFLSMMKGRAMTDEDKDKSKNTCDFRDYDMAVRELAFDRSKRASPMDRLKTDEEVAKEEKEKLQRLEQDRQRRMTGETDDDRQHFGVSADALGDGYEISAMNLPQLDRKKERKPAEGGRERRMKAVEIKKKESKAAETSENYGDEDEDSSDEDEDGDSSEEEQGDERGASDLENDVENEESTEDDEEVGIDEDDDKGDDVGDDEREECDVESKESAEEDNDEGDGDELGIDEDEQGDGVDDDERGESDLESDVETEEDNEEVRINDEEEEQGDEVDDERGESDVENEEDNEEEADDNQEVRMNDDEEERGDGVDDERGETDLESDVEKENVKNEPEKEEEEEDSENEEKLGSDAEGERNESESAESEEGENLDAKLEEGESESESGAESDLVSEEAEEEDKPTCNGRLPQSEAETGEYKSEEVKAESDVAEEVPFTFEVPVEYDDFWELLQKRAPSQVSTIVKRMISCNHPSLGGDNDIKANTIFAYILQTLNIICEVDPEILREDAHPLSYVDPLIPHLYTLTQLSPPNCARSLTQVVDEKYEDYTAKKPRKYPYADTFIFLKVCGLLFPASDYHHDVMTRVISFLIHLLGEAKVTNGREVAALLFSASLLVEYLSRSARFVGELMNALNGILYLSIASDEVKLSLPITPPFKRVGPSSDLLVLESPYKMPSSFSLKFSLLNEGDLRINNNFKVCILNETLKLMGKLCHLWVNSPAVRPIFTPTTKLLKRIVRDNYPQETITLLETLQTSIQELPKQLTHLKREDTQVKVLRMFTPVTEEIVDGMKRRGGNKDLQERQKLMHKLKRERKGARRELKRDAQCLARQQLKEDLASDAERKRKVNLIIQGLATQESEYQKLKKMKSKK